MDPLLRIVGLRVGFGGRTVLHGVSLDLPRKGIVGLMGPAGVGKSTLLRTIGRWNEALPKFWCEGAVLLDGEKDLLQEISVERCHSLVPLLAQKARLFSATVLENIVVEEGGARGERAEELARGALLPLGLWQRFRGRLDEPVLDLSLGEQRMLSVARLVAGGGCCLLADEPLRDLSPEEGRELGELLRRVAESRCVLLVSHNQRVVRKLCGQVALMVEGRIVEQGEVRSFFIGPQTQMARDYIRLGNCAFRPEEIEPEREANRPVVQPKGRALLFPGGFHWIVEGLGGMQRPGLLQDEESDLGALEGLGCSILVSLTRKPHDPSRLLRHGIRGVHFPIRDMDIPEESEAASFCARVSAWLDRGEVVVFHCKAGLGRTGTLLASMLAYRGMGANEAIERVRRVNPRYIQTREQLAFVGRLAERFEASRLREGTSPSGERTEAHVLG